MGIILAKQKVLIRAIVLKNKPAEMLAASEKGTVPVLVLDESLVIDESLDIMLWALTKSDPQNLLYRDTPDALDAMLSLIDSNDKEFIDYLEKYKAASRYHDFSQLYYREQCELFVTHLEQRLKKHAYLMGDAPSLADYAILPFARQFSRVDKKWFRQQPYPNLNRWLNGFIQNPLHTKVMAQYPLWLDNHEDCFFGHD